MAEFYAHAPGYYDCIEAAGDGWNNDPSYRDLAQRLQHARRIVEVGCGRASLLRHHPDWAARYSGCDFSPELLAENARRHPAATFLPLRSAAKLPFADGSADAIFSLWVIEHTVFPHRFLLECCRVLAPGGQFILRCPDFLGAGVLSSQRTGFSAGTGRQKLRSGRWVDSILTGVDTRLRIPLRCWRLRREIGDSFAFYVNLAPVCFEDTYLPDFDATYIAYAEEIVHFLRGLVEFSATDLALCRQWPIYLCGTKVGAA
jgi:SAM-dependent methyltransferase